MKPNQALNVDRRHSGCASEPNVAGLAAGGNLVEPSRRVEGVQQDDVRLPGVKRTRHSTPGRPKKAHVISISERAMPWADRCRREVNARGSVQAQNHPTTHRVAA